MEYTTEELQSYAARLIAKGKELRNALRERSRDLARFKRHGMSADFRSEAKDMHEGHIEAILEQKVPLIADESSPE